MLLKHLQKKIRCYCDLAYPKKLYVECSQSIDGPFFNHACHYNADAQVRQGKAVAIVECVMIHGNDVTLHYVNLDSRMAAYDVTLGPLYVGADYRMLEVLRNFPDDDPWRRLDAKKREILKAAGVSDFLVKLYGVNILL